jgi:ABC-2 type transport system ATP-binding protein
MKQVETALALRGLTKRFDRLAVDALDLTIRSGEFYALLGPNGAGKTTTLRMVAGLLRPDAGSVSVLGIDALANPVAAKQVMAWVSDEPMIYDKLTPLEYLEFVAGLWGIDPKFAETSAHDLLVSLGLEPHLHERCEGFSKGMRQNVALERKGGPSLSLEDINNFTTRAGQASGDNSAHDPSMALHEIDTTS